MSEVSYWEPLSVSLIISVFIGYLGMAILYYGTRLPRKYKLISIHSQSTLVILFMAAFVRSFYWVIWAWPGTPLDKNNIGIPIGVRVFLLMYPQLNMLLNGFVIVF